MDMANVINKLKVVRIFFTKVSAKSMQAISTTNVCVFIRCKVEPIFAVNFLPVSLEKFRLGWKMR